MNGRERKRNLGNILLNFPPLFFTFSSSLIANSFCTTLSARASRALDLKCLKSIWLATMDS